MPRTRSSVTAERAGARAAASLLELLPVDVINLIAASLGDALEPWHVYRFSSTSRGMRLALTLLTECFRAEHEASTALLERIGMRWRTVTRRRPMSFESQKRLSSVDAPSVCRLLRSAAFARITELELIDCALGDSAVDAVRTAAAAGGLAKLTRLYLSGNGLSTEGSRALGHCLREGHLRKLTGLYLHQNGLGDAGVCAFADAFRHGALPKLKKLGLVEVGLGCDGMKSLMAAAESGGLAHLQCLFVHRNQIDVAGAEALALAISLGRLDSLKRINLSPEYHNVDSLLEACSARDVCIDST